MEILGSGSVRCFCLAQLKPQASIDASAEVLLAVSVCSQSQKVSKAALWQLFLHLEEVALKTEVCWLHRLSLNRQQSFFNKYIIWLFVTML